MELDHISYATTHEQLSDTVQRLGSRLGTTFVDGGIHPRFGTRNFTAPLLDGKYIEVVCPLDHPATESTPWGKAVLKKANEGGGWLTWVFSTSDMEPLERLFERESVIGNRMKPDGSELRWKQIGVLSIESHQSLPFFIQWLDNNHPSRDGIAVSRILKIEITDKSKLEKSLFKDQILESLGNVELVFADENGDALNSGISSVDFLTPNGLVTID